MKPAPATASRDPIAFALLLLMALFATLLVRTAWLCDDAYITFRVVDNLWQGYGLRWNAVDRVQAYTHPLWMMTMAALYGVTRDAYYTSLAASIALSLGAAWIVAWRVAASPAHALLALLALSLSRAFVDYSSSGLESPLQHLLLALFGWQYFGAGGRAPARLFLLAGLLGLNRLDSLLLVGPALAAASIGRPLRSLVRPAALLALPLLGWAGFSVFYYGFPLPNTAYAKLATGVPQAELTAQGLHYLFNSLSIDPLTLLVVLAAVSATLARGPLAGWPLAVGVLLSLAYVVRIGGDFMSGRFLASPLLVAAMLLARVNVTFTPLPIGLACAAMLAVALSGPTPNLATTAFFFSDRAERRALVDERGITDERAIYYRYTGLLTARRGEPMPHHHLATLGRRLRAEGRRLIEHGQIGILGFHAGPGLHIMESNALTDAFLARLPARPGWRIGHFGRRIPAGYEGTLRTGANRLTDPSLRALYRKVALATRGPLFDRERLAAVWDLNFGPGRHVIDEYFVAHAGLQRAALASFSVPRRDGDDPLQGTRRLSDWGIEIELGRLRHPLAIELSLDQNDAYRLVCLNRRVALAELDIPPRVVPQGGLSIRRVELDRKTARWGCDALRVLPMLGDQDYRLGHVAILAELAGAELDEPGAELASPEPAASEPPGEGEERKQDDRLPGGR